MCRLLGFLSPTPVSAADLIGAAQCRRWQDLGRLHDDGWGTAWIAADAAEAIARATVASEAQGETYELGGPSVWTFEDILKFILRETNRRNILLPLPFPVARLIGSLAQIPAVIGLAPALTKDQVVLLESDNVVAPGAKGLADLGVEPSGLEAIAPSYLWRYRDGGQYAESPAA